MQMLPFDVAVICASNQNRSMAAMKKLVDAGYKSVASYGTGNRVNLPGPSPTQPNIYEFGVPYKVRIFFFFFFFLLVFSLPDDAGRTARCR
jgi:hypothetical protein